MKTQSTKSTLTKVAFFEPVDGKLEYFFGSLRAIYTRFTEDEVGCNLETLYAHKISKGNAYVSNKCRITKETMERTARKGNSDGNE